MRVYVCVFVYVCVQVYVLISVAEKTLVCYKGDVKPIQQKTNNVLIYMFVDVSVRM